MAVKQLIQYPSKLLKQESEKIEEINEEIKVLCQDLIETAEAYSAEGLSAVQIGCAKTVFTIKDQETQKYIICINPKIVENSLTELSVKEGCLSFPGIHELVSRADSVVVEYADIDNNVFSRTLFGINAVAFQHELDHLGGVLFVDRMGSLQRSYALRKLNKLNKKSERHTKRLLKMLKEQKVIIDNGQS